MAVRCMHLTWKALLHLMSGCVADWRARFLLPSAAGDISTLKTTKTRMTERTNRFVTDRASARSDGEPLCRCRISVSSSLKKGVRCFRDHP